MDPGLAKNKVVPQKQAVVPKTRSINLIPDVPEEEVKKVHKKGKLNLFGVFSVFLIAFVSVFILLGNLFVRVDLNNKTKRLRETENEIVSLQYIELKQKTLNTKVSTYESVSDHDFSSEIVLNYLLEVAGSLSEVRSMYLDDAMTFSVNGSSDSYLNVARIWHEMCSQKDYFNNVGLEHVSLNDEDDEVFVTYSFNGEMVRENIGNL